METSGKRRLFGAAMTLLVLLISSAGCSRSEVQLAKVTGTVTLDGKPLPDAILRFIPEGKGRTAIGRTDAEGRYELSYSATAGGAIVGKVRVEITTAEEFENSRGNTEFTKELIPKKYNRESELFKEITPRKNVVNFDLVSGR